MKKIVWLLCFGIGGAAGLVYSVFKNTDFFVTKLMKWLTSWSSIAVIGLLYAAWNHTTIQTNDSLVRLGVLTGCLVLLHFVANNLNKSTNLK